MKKLLILTLPLVLALGSCTANNKANTTVTGNDRDKHGCIPSAGYSWSNVKGKCVKVFEVGTTLKPVAAKDQGINGYVILSKDGSQAEIYIPNEKNSKLLHKSQGFRSGKYRYDAVKKIIYINNTAKYRVD